MFIKKLKRISLLFIVFSVLFSSYSINFNALAAKVNIFESQKDINYITNKNIDDYNINNHKVKVTKTNELDRFDAKKPEYILIDQELLENSDVKSKLPNLFNNESKIFIIGENLSKNDVRDYFGLKAKTYTKEENKINNTKNESENMVDVSQFKTIGYLVSREPGITNVTQLKVEEHENINKVEEAIAYVFNYDYKKLALGEEKLVELNLALAYSYSWTNVDVDSDTYSTARGNITTSSILDKNDGNPNSNGEYLFYSGYKIDVDMASGSGYVVQNTVAHLKGKSGCKVYDYGPSDGVFSQSGPISFTLSFMHTSFGFTPISKTVVSKTSGGLDSDHVEIKYDYRNWLGLKDYWDSMRAEVHMEGYQTSSYFEAKGQFHVSTHYETLSDANTIIYIDSLTYYNGAWDIVSGS